jgi:hypothetical protein
MNAEPLSASERAETKAVLDDMVRRGLIERTGNGCLRVAPAGESEARRSPVRGCNPQ